MTNKVINSVRPRSKKSAVLLQTPALSPVPAVLRVMDFHYLLKPILA